MTTSTYMHVWAQSGDKISVVADQDGGEAFVCIDQATKGSLPYDQRQIHAGCFLDAAQLEQHIANCQQALSMLRPSLKDAA